MGLGRFGGGVGVVRFLADRGARITLTDLQSEEELEPSLAELDGTAIETCHLGRHCQEDFVTADLIVVNPAVPLDNHFVRIAQRAKIPLTTEISLFWQFNHGPVIGVTGSNGKSTTASMICSILKEAGMKCWLGGNMGGSLLTSVNDITADDWVILELSSFQLAHLDRMMTSPQIAVATNFAPNHLDWHHTLDDYRHAKQAIFRWQTPIDTAILSPDLFDDETWTTNGNRFSYGTEYDHGDPGLFGEESEFIFRDAIGDETIFSLMEPLAVPGRHNLQNGMAAACAALVAGADAESVCRGLSRFDPLPHRLEFVAEVAGRSFYNDSLSTTPESTLAALDSFDEPILLLAGGANKQVELTEMIEGIAERAKGVACMGQLGPQISERLIDISARCTQQVCTSFEQAFDWVCSQSAPGDVILLSPGCASYDWFKNFAERGEQFVKLVRNWAP